MSKPICWVEDDDDKCYWQREWQRLYYIACDMTKSNDELRAFLELLHPSEEEE